MLTNAEVLALRVGQGVWWRGPANEFLCRVERNVMGWAFTPWIDEGTKRA
jgi:hypothetical protein